MTGPAQHDKITSLLTPETPVDCMMNVELIARATMGTEMIAEVKGALSNDLPMLSLKIVSISDVLLFCPTIMQHISRTSAPPLGFLWTRVLHEDKCFLTRHTAILYYGFAALLDVWRSESKRKHSQVIASERGYVTRNTWTLYKVYL